MSIKDFLCVQAVDVNLMSAKQRELLNKINKKSIDLLKKVCLPRE